MRPTQAPFSRELLTRARDDALMAEDQLDGAMHTLVGEPRHDEVAVGKLFGPR